MIGKTLKYSGKIKIPEIKQELDGELYANDDGATYTIVIYSSLINSFVEKIELPRKIENCTLTISNGFSISLLKLSQIPIFSKHSELNAIQHYNDNYIHTFYSICFLDNSSVTGGDIEKKTGFYGTLTLKSELEQIWNRINGQYVISYTGYGRYNPKILGFKRNNKRIDLKENSSKQY